MHRVSITASLSALLILLAGQPIASADTWPAKAIKAVVPFGAGSATDVIPRLVFEELQTHLGQTIVVENRGGAGGTIGALQVVKSDPDGYTWLVHSSAHTVAPALYPSLPFNAEKDLVPMSMIGSVPNVLIISPEKGIKTVKDFVAYGKANPGKLNFASVGIGSAVHMSAERFRVSAGYEAVHIPFKGGAEALSEVIAGRVDYYFCPIATALPHIRAGKLLALAVSSKTRAPQLPDVPTTLEAGFPDSDYTLWVGILGPVGTPKPAIDKLNADMKKALASPSLKEKLDKIGVQSTPMAPEEFGKLIKDEITTYGAFVKKAGLKVN
jgi:tripartite-type tricarboxylate transporter receptor subunit TctC